MKKPLKPRSIVTDKPSKAQIYALACLIKIGPLLVGPEEVSY